VVDINHCTAAEVDLTVDAAAGFEVSAAASFKVYWT